MPTNNPRISFALSTELLKEIDEYRYSHRIKNQTQAIIQLINRGFEAIAGTYEEPPKLTNDEELLISEYRAAPQPIKQAAHNILWPYLEQEEKSRA